MHIQEAGVLLMKDVFSHTHLRSTIVVGIGNAIGYALNLVFFILCARYMPIREFGVFRYFIALGMIVYSVLFSGMFTAITQFLGEKKYGNVVTSSVIFTAVCLIMILPVLYYIGSIAFTMICVALYISQIVYSVLRGMGFYRMLAYYLITTNASRILLLLLLLFFTPALEIFAGIYLLASVFPLPFLISRVLGKKLHTSFSYATLKKVLRFSVPLYISGIAYILLGNLDAVFISAYLSDVELSWYMSAKTLMAVFVFAPFAVSTVLLPETARDKRLARNLRFGVSFVLLVSTCIAIPFLLFPKNVILLVYPHEYLDAYVVLPVLSLGMCFFSLSDVFASVWTGFGKPVLEGFVYGVAACVNALTLYIIVPKLGILGGAISLLLAYGVSLMLWVCLTVAKMRKG